MTFNFSLQGSNVFILVECLATLHCIIRPDALFNGVSFVVLQISVQFLQFEKSLFPGGLCPG